MRRLVVARSSVSDRWGRTLFVLVAVSCLSALAGSARAAVTMTGNVEPNTASQWNTGYDGYIGRIANGSLAIDAGSGISSNYSYLGYNSGVTGTVSVDGSGSSWTTRNVYAGYSGNGTLYITGGGKVTGSGYLGYNAGATGAATIDGSGSLWSCSNLYVGSSGTGTLNITNGGTVSASTVVYVDPAGTARGTIQFNGGTLTAATLWASPTRLAGAGTINVRSLVSDVDLLLDATHGLSQSLLLNGQPGQNIAVNLDMTNSTATGELGVGYRGNGSLTVHDGLAVSSKSGYLGYDPGAMGVATVAGNGSTWAINGNLEVGRSGSGTLSIANGGAVSVTGATYVAHNAGSTGAISFDGGTLTTQTLWASPNQLTGAGTIIARGMVSDVDLLFDSTHSTTQTFTLDGQGGRIINVTLDLSSARGDLGAGYRGSGSLAIREGKVVQSNAGYLGWQSGSTGLATVDGTGSYWSIRNDLTVGNSGNGTMRISNGAAVYNSTGYVGYNAGSVGTVTVDGTGSLWSSNGSGSLAGVYVGYTGTGTVNVANGGTVATNSAYVGYTAGSTGVATVDGNGSTWTTSSSLTVGGAGNGTLNISNGGAVTVTQNTIVGAQPGGAGMVHFGPGGGTLSTGSLMASPSQLTGTGTIAARGLVSDIDLVFGSPASLKQTVTLNSLPNQNVAVNLDLASSPGFGTLGAGWNGNGTLAIRGATVLAAQSGILGYNAGSSGVATIDGAGTKWTTSLDLQVGLWGSGAMNITNGATVSAGSGSTIGNMSGSTGAVTVNGTGSTWATSVLFVGLSGGGTLSVTGGGSITSASYSSLFPTSLGYDSGATGNVTVDGAGSTWTNNNSAIYVGCSGSGTLRITGGGVMNNTRTTTGPANGYIGYNAGSTGAVVVDGSGSKWLNTDSLYVGVYGSGTLTVTNGAAVSNSTGYLNSTGVATINGVGSTWTNTSELQISGSSAGAALTISGGGTISDTNGYLGSSTNSRATATVDGAGSRWINSGTFYVGNSGDGTLNVTNGGAVSNVAGYVGLLGGATSAVTVAGTGSAWTSSGELNVAYGNRGTLDVRDGGTVSNTNGYIGNSIGSTGTVTVDGTGSTWTNSGDLSVGYSGSGTLNITNGGTVSVTGTTYAARNAGAAGSINFGTAGGTLNTGALAANQSQYTGMGTINTRGLIDDVDLVFNAATGTKTSVVLNRQPSQNITLNVDMGVNPSGSNDLGVALNGSGSLTIRDAVAITSRAGYLGYNSGSTGTASVDGTGSKWTASGSLYVGHAGNGTLSVTNGGAVSSNTGSVGRSSGSSGTVLLTGTGSAWTSSGELDVGYYGSGTLTVANGAAVSNATGYLGYYAGSAAAVTVTGSGSTWTNSGNLTVGYSGAGTLSVAGGATVNNGVVDIGYNTTATGTVTVEGTGSAWNVNGELHVGSAGSGVMNLRGGGRVDSKSGYLGKSGGPGAVNVTGAGSIWQAGNLYVGYGGNGRLTITEGGCVNGKEMDVGLFSGPGINTVTIDGIGSTCSVGYLYLSNAGKLIVTGGGLISASPSITSASLLAMDIGSNSRFTVSQFGSFANDGTVRLSAGARPTAGATFTPISSTSWSGKGTYQALGGTWNTASHVFTVSDIQSGTAGTPLSLDLHTKQRALLSDSATGWSLGASFLARTSSSLVDFTASPIGGSTASALQGLLAASESVLSGWTCSATGGYTTGDPAYLSFLLGGGYSRNNLDVWRYDGTKWSALAADDITYDGAYASFTVTGFSAYAVTGMLIRPGDANCDGRVDIADLNKALTNYNHSGMTWADGDFDGDGLVAVADLNKVLTNYNQTAAVRAVPEPSTVVLLAIGAMGLLVAARCHCLLVAARRQRG